ncbi:MAG: DUF2203 domain-containing protein [Isosphaeraceae bacterium]
MAPSKPAEPKKTYFTVAEANRTLPLVKAIVEDVVRQYGVVNVLQQRLTAVISDHRRPSSDPYSEELAQTQAELQEEEQTLKSYIDELKQLGVELKSPDGVCDFRSMQDGREIYLCWRLGEPEVAHWHELSDGSAGRRPLASVTKKLKGSGAV